MRLRRQAILRPPAILAVWAMFATTAAYAQLATSPSFVLQQATFASGGSTMASASYSLGSSFGQESVVGVSAAPHFVLQSGFWSWSGTGLVPVLLMMTKNTLDPADYDADWTGNNSPYLLYRSANCTDVFASYLLTVGSNSWIDTAPPSDALVCYNVLATAPGPTPPPMTPYSSTMSGAIETLPAVVDALGQRPEARRNSRARSE